MEENVSFLIRCCSDICSEMAFPISPMATRDNNVSELNYYVFIYSTVLLTDYRSGDGNTVTGYLLTGTHTSGNDRDYIQILSVELPANLSRNTQIKDIPIPDTNTIDPNYHKIKVYKKYDHEGEVNKARYMPQDSNIIATMSNSGDALIFNRKSLPSGGTGKCLPVLRLKHHKKEGYGLSWNPLKKGSLLTGADDSSIALWDITSKPDSSSPTILSSDDIFVRNTLPSKPAILNPIRTFDSHTAIVNDVQWHNKYNFLFGSVSDDLSLQIFDTRNQKNEPVIKTLEAHTDAINALGFSPFSETILATASADNTVALWDLRKLTKPVRTLTGHNSDVTTLQWSPFDETILASGGHDRRIIIWDLSKLEEENTSSDLDDSPPEMLFLHGGHTNRISDFSWSTELPWVIASAAEDNLLDVWKPSLPDEEENPEIEAEHGNDKATDD